DRRRIAGRDRPALAEHGLQRRQLLERRVGARVLVTDEAIDGDELVVEPAGLGRGSPALLRPESECVLVLARDRPPLGDVLGRLAYRLEREPRLHPPVRAAPADTALPP